MKKKIIIGSLSVLIIAFHWALYKESFRIKKYKINSWTEDKTADCAVVLTGGAGRVREGFDLLSQGQIKKLIISGVNPSSRLRDIFPQIHFYGDLKTDDVVLEKRSGTTYGNAQQSIQILEALHCRDVLLVTSRLHMHRSLKTFQAVFPKEMLIYPRATLAGHYRPRVQDLYVESIKSLFYSLWVY